MAQKLEYLEGLRGVAAFIVVLFHFALSFYPSLVYGNPAFLHAGSVEIQLSQSVLNVLYNGNFGVCIFFVLSGFVLTRKFFEKKDREILSSGAFRRYFRLLPVVLASILLVVACLQFSLFYNVKLLTINGGPLLANYVVVTPVLINGTREFSGGVRVVSVALDKPDFFDALRESFIGAFLFVSKYNPVLWTIQVEFVGSLMIFTYAFLFGSMKERWLGYLVPIIVLWDYYVLGLVLGMIIADFHASGPWPKFMAEGGWLSWLLIALGLFFGSYNEFGNMGHNIYTQLLPSAWNLTSVTYHLLGATLLLLGLLSCGALKTLLGGKVGRFLGRISFSLYAFHVTLMLSFSCLVFWVLSPYLSYNLDALVTLIVSVPFMLIASHYISRFIDEPGIRLSKQIYHRLYP